MKKNINSIDFIYFVDLQNDGDSALLKDMYTGRSTIRSNISQV